VTWHFQPINSIGDRLLRFAPIEAQIARKYESKIVTQSGTWRSTTKQERARQARPWRQECIKTRNMQRIAPEEGESVDENEGHRGRFAGASESILLSCRRESRAFKISLGIKVKIKLKHITEIQEEESPPARKNKGNSSERSTNSSS
jgi:hypothetical protein